MSDKSLKKKAVKIKGKDYVLVSDRVLFFNENYNEGCITTDLVKWEGNTIVIKATIFPEGLEARHFTGYAQETVGDGMVNKTSALENAETSAVGRALAMMGIGVIDSIASVDEINKATNNTKEFQLTGKKLDPNATRKTCETCKQEFNPNPKAVWAKDCFECWKKKQDGEEVTPVVTDDDMAEALLTDADIPF